MTKLEELKAAREAADAAWAATWAGERAAARDADAAYEDYQAELKKTKEPTDGIKTMPILRR